MRFAAQPAGLTLLLLTIIAAAPGRLTADEPGSADTVESKKDAAVKLQLGTWDELQRYVGSQQGRVVVVDVWSTSCVPCMKEFPHLVELSRKHSDDVVCVSFCVDYAGIRSRPPEHYRERVEKFLTEQEATFRNYLCVTPSDELFEAIDLISIPAAYVYGRDGQLARRFDATLLEDGEDEAFTYQADILPFVSRMLKPE